MPWAIEITDTFGGEPNYLWVKRYSLPDELGLSNRQVVRRAKAAAGWNGLRCRTDVYGDEFVIRPVGSRAPCWVMFVTWVDTVETADN